MVAVRAKSVELTAYLERLLDRIPSNSNHVDFEIITPRAAAEHGAQLSIRLRPGLLDPVMEFLDERGVIVDERKPDVIRVAPAPLYNTFRDVWAFCKVFEEACQASRHSQLKKTSTSLP
jgi:kynureninase